MEWAGTPPWRVSASDATVDGHEPVLSAPEDIPIVAAARLDFPATADLHHLLGGSGDANAGGNDGCFRDAVGEVDVGDSNAGMGDAAGTGNIDDGGGGPSLASADLDTVDELWRELIDDPGGLTAPAPRPTTAGGGEAPLDPSMPPLQHASAALVGVSSPKVSPPPLAAIPSVGLPPPPLPPALNPSAGLPPRPLSAAQPLPTLTSVSPASAAAAASAAASAAATSVPPPLSAPLPWGLPLSDAVAGRAPMVVAAVASALLSRGGTARTAREGGGALTRAHSVTAPPPPSSSVALYLPPPVAVRVAQEDRMPLAGVVGGAALAGPSAAPGGVVPVGAIGADVLGLPSCGEERGLPPPYSSVGWPVASPVGPPPPSSAATTPTALAGASTLVRAPAADAAAAVMPTSPLRVPAAANTSSVAAAGSWTTPPRTTLSAAAASMAKSRSSPTADWVAAIGRPCTAAPLGGLAAAAAGKRKGEASAASDGGVARGPSQQPAVAAVGMAAAGVGTAVAAVGTAAAAPKPPPQRRRGSAKHSRGSGQVSPFSTTSSGAILSSPQPSPSSGTVGTRKGGVPVEKGAASTAPPNGEGTLPLPAERMPEPMIRKHKKNAAASRYCHLCGRTSGTATKAAASARAAAAKAGTTAGAAAKGVAAVKGGTAFAAAASNPGGRSSSAKAEGRGTSPATDEEGSLVVLGAIVAADAAIPASPSKVLPPLTDLMLSPSLAVPPADDGGGDRGEDTVRSASTTDLDATAGSNLPAATPRRHTSSMASSSLSSVSAGDPGGVGSLPTPTFPLPLPDMVVCRNNRYGVCRKSTCASCFRLHGWDFAAAVAAVRTMADAPWPEGGGAGGGGDGSGGVRSGGNSISGGVRRGGGVSGGSGGGGNGGGCEGGGWICTHCRHACPPTASCVTYGRTNGRRRVLGVTRRRLIQQALAAGEDASALLRAHGLG